MPRWLRVARGMIGTGLTFGAGVGAVSAIAGGIAWLGNKISGVELLQIVGKISVAAFLLGVGFSAVLAITAGGRRFSKLSLRLVGGLGAGAGLLYFLFLAMNGGRNWSAKDAIANFVLLLAMGAVSATAMLVVARRGRAALDSVEDVPGLAEGEPEIVRARGRTKTGVATAAGDES